MRHFLILVLLALPPSLPASPSAAESDSNKPVIIVLGDSISAGYGIDIKQGWVSLLQQKLKQNHYRHQVINASVSGDTSGGGLARLPFLLKQHQPTITIVELGGNDGLRGLPIPSMQKNFSAIIELCRQNGSKVLLLGMLIPPNYGPKYSEAFQQTFLQLSQQQQIPLVPFFLRNIATKPDLMQPDGIHPTQAAQTILLDNIWKTLQPLL